MSKEKHRIFNHKTALFLSIVISILFFLIMLLTFIYAKSQAIGRGLRLYDVITLQSLFVFISNVILLYIQFRFQFWVIKIPNKPGRKKIGQMLLGSLLLTFVLSPTFSGIELWSHEIRLPSNVYMTIHFTKDLVLLLISFLFTMIVYTWSLQQKAVVDNQSLMVENLQNRYDALKSQVDPHFLFNSLNTLNGLIGYDDDKAHEYLTELSSVFRYTMQNRPVVKLEEELEFAESYTQLMMMRYGEGLHFEFRIEEKYLNYFILPFGVQLLLENAVKHNIVSKKRPLSVLVETQDDVLRVRNNLQPKPDGKHGGVGLANLNERYSLMFGMKVSVVTNEEFFVVEVPLVQDVKHTTIKVQSNHESSCC